MARSRRRWAEDVVNEEDDERASDGDGDPDEAAYRAAAAGDILPVDFNLFVLSLNTSALLHLGEAVDAEGNTHRDLPMARHTIDLLGMLEEKTRGNLSGDEERLLHQVLFDLRMRFTRAAASSST
jgi:hypothetical protein